MKTQIRPLTFFYHLAVVLALVTFPAVGFAQVTPPPGGATDNCERASISEALCNLVVTDYLAFSNGLQEATVDGTLLANIDLFFDDPDTDSLQSGPTFPTTSACDATGSMVLGFDAFEAASAGFTAFDIEEVIFASRHFHVVTGKVVFETAEMSMPFCTLSVPGSPFPPGLSGALHSFSAQVAEKTNNEWTIESNSLHLVVLLDGGTCP